jgi:hypothetical protein
MRENFTSGSVGRAPGNRCLYPEGDAKGARLISAVMQDKKGDSLNEDSLPYFKRFAYGLSK